MRGIRRLSPIVRAVGVIGVVAGLVTSVTFAALNSQATLTNTTINSVSANLKLWDGDSFEPVAPGFTITGLVPGVGVENAFYVQNAGDAALAVTAHVPGAPAASGFTGWENLQVTITSNAPGCVSNFINTDMGQLLAGQVTLPCNPLSAGAQGNSGVPATEGNYKIKFDINPAAVSGSQATVGAFNIDFTGTAVAPVVPEV